MGSEYAEVLTSIADRVNGHLVAQDRFRVDVSKATVVGGEVSWPIHALMAGKLCPAFDDRLDPGLVRRNADNDPKLVRVRFVAEREVELNLQSQIDPHDGVALRLPNGFVLLEEAHDARPACGAGAQDDFF